MPFASELGEDVRECLWYENEGDDPEGEIGSPDSGRMSARAYQAWCEQYWQAWRLPRRWTGLPPELAPEDMGRPHAVQIQANRAVYHRVYKQIGNRPLTVYRRSA